MTPQQMMNAAMEVMDRFGPDVKMVPGDLFKILQDGRFVGWIESRTGKVHDYRSRWEEKTA